MANDAIQKKYEAMVIFNGPNGPFSNDRLFDAAEYEAYLNPEEVEETEETEEELEDDAPEGVDYSGLSGKELKALAIERELDTKGMTKKSEIVSLLEANDSSE